MRTATLLTVLAFAAAGPALADRSGEREAKALFKEANQLAGSGDLAGALELFQTAYERFPNPKILINMGAVLEAMGRDVEAAQTYERLAQDADASRSLQSQAKDKLAALDAKLGRLLVQVDQAGAQVLVDGNAVGESGQPLVVRLKPGGHAVSAKKEGFVPAAEAIEVVAGQVKTLALTLQAIGAAPAAPAPTAAKSPAMSAAVPSAAIDDPALSARSEAPPADKPIWKRWPFWAGVGAVVAGGVVAGVLLTRGGDEGGLPEHNDVVDTR